MKHLVQSVLLMMAACCVHAQSTPENCPFKTERVTIDQYTVGMNFYFPRTKTLVEADKVIPEMEQEIPCAPDTAALLEVTYRDVAGKVMQITRIDSLLLNSYPGGNYWEVYYTLKNTACTDQYIYTLVIDKRDLSVADIKKSKGADYGLRGAIFEKDVDEAKQQLTKEYYALFPIKGKKYEKVKIKEVTAGSWETPIRITFNTGGTKDTSIDVNISGTNTLRSFAAYHFTNYFSCEDPLKDVTAARRPVLQAGEPQIGMTTDEIKLMLGKPQKTNQTLASDGTTAEYTYSDYVISFKDNKVIKIVNTQ